MIRKNIAWYSIIILVLFCCVQSRVWQGKYITLKTTEIPKEDFTVGEDIVVAYAPIEYDKNSDIIYRFDIMKNGRKKRVIDFSECALLVTERPAVNLKDKGKDYNYALMEINPEFINEMKSSPLIGGKTYKLYEKFHSYDEIKQEVIDLILGRDLLPE